jgi:hypothetical protein
VRLTRPVSLEDLKEKWLEMQRTAHLLVESLPASEVGCLYLDVAGHPITPDPNSAEFGALTRHYGQLRGSWPRVMRDDNA